MSFKKPFRAVPIRPGDRHQNQQRTRQRSKKMSNSQFAVILACLSATTFGFVWAQTEPKANPPAAEQPREFLAADTVYYAGCNEARAAGAAPIHKGEPGYREELDGDGDGIACEPYRQR